MNFYIETSHIMISNEQGRCCSHVALMGVRGMFGVPEQRVRIIIHGELYFYYFLLFFLFCF